MHPESATRYGAGGMTRPGAADRVSMSECPVCARARQSGTSDPWRELVQPARRRGGAEAIADHLGFCARHAAALGGQRWPPGVAAAAAEAFGILAAMLDDRARFEERLVHMMFRARQGCAACTLERRRMPIEPAALVAAAGRLCLPHYLAAAAKSDERQLALLAAGALRSARSWHARLANGRSTRAALDWLAGAPAQPAMAAAAPSRIRSQCPVCGCAARALEKWLRLVSTGVRLGAELRALLPLCPVHIRMCVERCGPRAAREVARQATQAVAATLERGMAENERAVQRDREQASGLWYRRRGAAYVLGLRRRALRLPHCGACERVELACQQAQGEILDLVASRGGRDLLARKEDLCLRHFGGVYLLTPHGEPRAALAVRQRAALERAQAALAGGGAGDAWTVAASRLGAAVGYGTGRSR
jgi:hypothetical protein